MGLADDLWVELFHWLEKQEKCADYLVDLAKDLEQMKEAVTAGQLVGNAATVLGSTLLIGTGIATLMTAGLAAPLLVTVASVTAGAGAAASLGCKLLENWKSSDTMKNAEKTANEIKNILYKIERLQEKLTKDCESKNPEDMQPEITARILKAMAKRNGRDLSLTHLTRLLRNDDMSTHILPRFIQRTEFFTSVGSLLSVLGYSLIFAQSAAKAGAKYVPFAVATEGLAALSLKTVLKGTGQLAGGVFGLILTFPELVDNCEEMIKSNHQTNASKHLRSKAEEMYDSVRSLKRQLNELLEMLNEIPETKCHVDLGMEMFGSQIYTRGIICMEYKRTQKQDRKIHRFIFLSTKDMRETEIDIARKKKLEDKTGKNKRQKSAQTSGSQMDNVQQSSQSYQSESSQRSQLGPFHLPTITMSNLRSLPNKMEEIEDLMEDAEYFSSDLMFFTETWLNTNSRNISLDGYASFRVDRDPRLTQKSRGGGMMMLVNDNWASDVQVENISITPDYELMVVSIIPHNHPENAPPLTFIHVYVPGPNFNHAAAAIAGFFYDALEKSGGGPVFLLGDFNRCNITPYFNNLEQYVTCPTRHNNILDMCYGNVPRAYSCVCSPPLGRSDHNVIHLIPKGKRNKTDPSKDWKCMHDHSKPKKQ